MLFGSALKYKCAQITQTSDCSAKLRFILKREEKFYETVLQIHSDEFTLETCAVCPLLPWHQSYLTITAGS